MPTKTELNTYHHKRLGRLLYTIEQCMAEVDLMAEINDGEAELLSAIESVERIPDIENDFRTDLKNLVADYLGAKLDD